MGIEHQVTEYLRENGVIKPDKFEMEIRHDNGYTVVVNDLIIGFVQRFIRDNHYVKDLRSENY